MMPWASRRLFDYRSDARIVWDRKECIACFLAITLVSFSFRSMRVPHVRKSFLGQQFTSLQSSRGLIYEQLTGLGVDRETEVLSRLVELLVTGRSFGRVTECNYSAFDSCR